MNLYTIKNIIKSVLLESTQVRTLYVFDFDHTLADTYVKFQKDLVRINNDAKPIKEIFDIFVSKTIKYPNSTYILTARSIDSKKSIIEWLKNHDIFLDSKNIICVGYINAANKKKNWIKNKALKKNAERVIFWDDKQENIVAVNSLKDKILFPEMKKIKIITRHIK